MEHYRKWVETVESDPESASALYRDDAILLPTFCSRVRYSPAERKDYFRSLATPLRITTQSVHVQSQTCVTGEYTYVLEDRECPARFLFVFDEAGKILAHHSSAKPS